MKPTTKQTLISSITILGLCIISSTVFHLVAYKLRARELWQNDCLVAVTVSCETGPDWFVVQGHFWTLSLSIQCFDIFTVFLWHQDKLYSQRRCGSLQYGMIVLFILRPECYEITKMLAKAFWGQLGQMHTQTHAYTHILIYQHILFSYSAILFVHHWHYGVSQWVSWVCIIICQTVKSEAVAVSIHSFWELLCHPEWIKLLWVSETGSFKLCFSLALLCSRLKTKRYCNGRL